MKPLIRSLIWRDICWRRPHNTVHNPVNCCKSSDPVRFWNFSSSQDDWSKHPLHSFDQSSQSHFKCSRHLPSWWMDHCLFNMIGDSLSCPLLIALKSTISWSIYFQFYFHFPFLRLSCFFDQLEAVDLSCIIDFELQEE